MRTRRKRAFKVLFVLAYCLGLGGCVTPAERDFTAADVRVISLYVEKAQPAIEAYCDAVAAGGHADQAEQLRVDTRKLAVEIQADCKARLDKLTTSTQLIESARMALNLASAVLDALPAKREASGDGQTQPANH